jgi:Protein of unknown function (DUF3224)
MPQYEASGHFAVDLTPLAGVAGPVGAYSIAKTFLGDLAGKSSGMMAGYGGGSDGAAGYVAMELVTAVISERQGSFVLQHRGTRLDGEGTLAVDVLPGSGSGDLAGIAGAMTIEVTPGSHVYRFRYSLPG